MAEFNRRGGKPGFYCPAAWGWKGETFCVRGRWTRWHFGRHRDANGKRW